MISVAFVEKCSQISDFDINFSLPINIFLPSENQDFFRKSNL
jgi:hypothetical protein